MESEEGTQFWTHLLLPELRAIVRGFLDAPSKQMLRLTCKTELGLESQTEFRFVFLEAAAAGYLSLCQWIYDLCKDWKRFYGKSCRPYFDRLRVDEALLNHHLPLVEWAIDRGFWIGSGTMLALALNGDLETLRWAHSRGISLGFTEVPRDVYHLPVLKWFVGGLRLKVPSLVVLMAVWQLPHHADAVDYLLASYSKVLQENMVDNFLFMATKAALWPVVDYCRQKYPVVSSNYFEDFPAAFELYMQRAPAPPEGRSYLTDGTLSD